MSRTQANLLLLVAAAIWGLGNIAHKTILDHLDPLSVVGLSCLIGGILTLPLVIGERPTGEGRAWWLSLARVTALFALGVVLQQIAFAGTSVTNASFLISTTTVMTPIVAWLMAREMPGGVVLLAALMTLAGSFLLSGGIAGVGGAGDLIALIAAACFALWTVELGRHVQTYGRVFTTATAQFLGTALAILPFSALNGDLKGEAILAAWPELVVLGVFSTAAAFCLQTYAQRYTTACHAAVIVSAECLFAAIAAAVLLGERLSPDGIAGALIVFAAVLLVATSSRRQSAAVAPAA